MLFLLMNHANVKNSNEQKQVKRKRHNLSASLEIKIIWTFITDFLTIFNKTCTYNTFKFAVKQKREWQLP